MVINEARRRIPTGYSNTIVTLFCLCAVGAVAVTAKCDESDFCGVDSNCNRILSLPISKEICLLRDAVKLLGYKENFYCPDSPFKAKQLSISEVCALAYTPRKNQADFIKDPEGIALYILLGATSISLILAIKA